MHTRPMQFIELTGKTLLRIASHDEISPADLRMAGVTDDSFLRVNRQGDIELRRADRWDVIGGLLGDFAERLSRETGLDWA
ncbi:MAG: hypothetical protein JNM18_13730 [Planctomycetaceae bacterium]|nr:hypothetical protein [Planctomycetaceae bacterium]